MSRGQRMLGIVAGAVLVLFCTYALLRQVGDEPDALIKVASPTINEPSKPRTPTNTESSKARISAAESPAIELSESIKLPAGGEFTSPDDRNDRAASFHENSRGETGNVPPVDARARPRSAVDCWYSNEIASPHFHALLDRSVRTNGVASGSLIVDQSQPYPAQLFQIADARALRARRVEFSADVRSRLAGDTAGLRIRIYDDHGRLIAIKQELLSGPRDIDWTTLNVTLDVPAEARAASYELIVRDKGQAWIDNAHIEVSASPEVAKAENLSDARFFSDLTETANRPGNLDFELAPGSGCN